MQSKQSTSLHRLCVGLFGTGALIAGLLTTGCSSSTNMTTGGSGGSNGTAGANGAATCTPGQLQETGQLLGRYGSLDTLAADNTPSASHEYYLQVNQWNTAAVGNQTVGYGGGYFFKMLTQTATAATNGGPTGFPSMFIGANANHKTTDSNLPKLVSALTTVPTSWTWNDAGTLADPTNNSYNATYDVWFGTGPDEELSLNAPSGGYLMVWYHKPADAQPIGSVKYPNVSIPGVDGTWNIWIGPNNNKPVISYVRTTDTLSLAYDLNVFIQDAVNNRVYNGAPAIQSTWSLTNVFAGFEIWRGGVNLESTSFCAIVN